MFLEAIEGKDVNTARLSFSTKITDYLSSGKAIVAIGNKETAPMQYFVKNNIALVAGNPKEILQVFEKISSDNTILQTVAQNASSIAVCNHNAEKIRQLFENTIKDVWNNKSHD